LERYSQYNESFVPEDNISKLMEKVFDTSFCDDKLKLRYTKYNSGKEYFMQILATQLEKNLLRMPSWRPDAERKVVREQLGQANETIYNLNEYINKLKIHVPIDRTCKYYFDTGSGFNEEETIYFQYEKGRIFNYFKIALPENTKVVRFDPVEGSGCFLQDLIIKDDTGESVNYHIFNGFKSENNGIIFTDNDPQILININENVKELMINCSIWLFI
jgi:hypothetical protein